MHNVQSTGQNIKGDWLDFKKKFFLEYTFVIPNNQTHKI